MKQQNLLSVNLFTFNYKIHLFYLRFLFTTKDLICQNYIGIGFRHQINRILLNSHDTNIWLFVYHDGFMPQDNCPREMIWMFGVNYVRTCAISRSMTFWHSYGRPILAEFLAAAWSKNIFEILTHKSARCDEAR